MQPSDSASAPAAATHDAPPRRMGFRTDLAGLRGVAVLLVAVYHVWIGRVSGGVDVFLLMSAFFLTGGWVRAVESGAPRGVLSSWIKRSRGLLPAAVLVIAAVVLTTRWILPGTRWNDVINQAWASLGYAQNVHLANQAVDYYNPDHSTSSPLQHFWSLSVQGQVFLLWPLLLALAGWIATRLATRAAARSTAGTTTGTTAQGGTSGPLRFRAVCLWLFGAVFVLSLSYSVVFTASNQADAYFSTPARLWEFALGSLLALIADRLPALPLWLGRALGWLGMAALLSCGMLLQVEGQFPGYAALWPTLAAAAIVVAGSNPAPYTPADVSWWLSRKPATWLGSVSYPLYLWHWPVLVFTLAATGQAHPSWWQGALILLAALALAWLTHRWVEKPIATWAEAPRPAAAKRRAKAKQRALATSANAVNTTRSGLWLRRRARLTRRRAVGGVANHARPLAVVLLCLTVALPVGAWQLSLAGQAKQAQAQPEQDNPGAAVLDQGYVDEVAPSALPVPVPGEVKQDWANPGTECAGEWATTDESLPYCQEGGNLDSATTVVLVGDSHAQQWSPALDVAAEANDWHWVLVNLPGCRYGSTDEMQAAQECADFSEAAQAYVTDRAQDIRAVLTVATKTAFGAAAPDTTSGDSEVVVPGYEAAIRPWLSAGLPVIGLRDTPRFPYDPADCAANAATSDEDCTLPSSALLATSNPLNALTQGKARIKGFASMDLSDVVCPDGECTPRVGNVNVWMDNSHLTATFSRTTGTIFERRLTAAFQRAGTP